MPWVREIGAAIVMLTTLACGEGEGDADTGASSAGSSSGDASGGDASGGDASGGGESGTGTSSEPSWESLAERPCPPDSALTWENFGGVYVLSYCTSCHHSDLPFDARQLAPVAIDLETIELVRSHAERVWARAADQNQSMPPVGAPGPSERALLGEWLACGAPTNADLADE